MQTPGFAPTGALCAIHTDRAASQTCARCGNFMCSECSQNGTERTCPTCRALGGADAFPYARNDFDFSRLWDYAFDRWKQEWVMLAIGVLIVGALGMIGGIFSNVINQLGVGAAGRNNTAAMIPFLIVGTLVGQLVNVVVQGIGTMGLFRMVADVLQGRKADVNRMFSQTKKLPRYILMMLLLFLVVGVPVIVFMVVVGGAAFLVSGVSLSDGARAFDHMGPAPVLILALGFLVLMIAVIYFTLPLQFAAMELVYGDCEPWEAIKRSYTIGDGYRLQIFGYGFVGGLVTLLGLLVCCVGALPAVGLQQALMVSLYLSLRKGAGLPAPVEP